MLADAARNLFGLARRAVQQNGPWYSEGRIGAMTKQSPEQRKALGQFLASRRARLQPTDLGLTAGRRRTPGLRREEVAVLAGVSLS
jgi:hypothetical protein